MSTDRKSEAGFTLLEMLVVLGLLGLLVALSTPLLRGGVQAGLVERTAYRLSADLSTMRLAAIRHNTETALDFDLASSTYWGDNRLAPRFLPAQIEVVIDAPRSTVGARTLVSFRFFPDGSASGGRIVIGQGGQQRVITLDRLTGLPRVSRLPL